MEPPCQPEGSLRHGPRRCRAGGVAAVPPVAAVAEADASTPGAALSAVPPRAEPLVPPATAATAARAAVPPVAAVAEADASTPGAALSAVPPRAEPLVPPGRTHATPPP